MDKPREIEAKIGRIRPASRETYDYRTLTALPSATGGRPSTSDPLAAATGQEIIAAIPTENNPAPIPLGGIDKLVQNGSLRYAQQPQGVLGSITRLNRRLEDYTINNEDLVNITAAYIDRLAVENPTVLDGFSDAMDAARWSVAQIARFYEPGSAPPMVDIIHQSREGRKVYQYLRQIEEAQNAGA